MKKVFLLLVLVCFVASGHSQVSTTNEKLKTLMKNEPKVKDFVFTDAKVLYASVIDDGTNRNGYAQYLYYALKEVNIKTFKVVVVKLRSQNDPKRDNAYGVKLGEYKE